MKMFTAFIAFVFVSIFNTACVTEHQLVIKTHYVYLPIGEALTSKIIPEPPLGNVSRSEYVTASPEERNTILTKYIIDLTSNTISLNSRLDVIYILDEENKDKVNQLNLAEDARVNKIISDSVKAAKTLR